MSLATVGTRRLEYRTSSEEVTAIDVTNRAGLWWERICIRRDPGRLARHITRWDPARVLARSPPTASSSPPTSTPRAHQEENPGAPAGELHALEAALKIRAERFDDRPGYREAWRTASTAVRILRAITCRPGG